MGDHHGLAVGQVLAMIALALAFSFATLGVVVWYEYRIAALERHVDAISDATVKLIKVIKHEEGPYQQQLRVEFIKKP